MKRIPRATISYPFPHEFDAGKYPAYYLLSAVPEKDVQSAILDLLRLYDVDAIAVDAGAKGLRQTLSARMRRAGFDAKTISSLLSGGLGSEIPAGHSDIVGTLAPSGCGLYIECKRPATIDESGKVLESAGRAEPEQLDFLLSKFERGAIVMVAYSQDDVKHYLQAELLRNLKAMRDRRGL